MGVMGVGCLGMTEYPGEAEHGGLAPKQPWLIRFRNATLRMSYCGNSDRITLSFFRSLLQALFRLICEIENDSFGNNVSPPTEKGYTMPSERMCIQSV